MPKHFLIAGSLIAVLFLPGLASAQSPTPDRIGLRALINSRIFIASGQLTAKSGSTLTLDKAGQSYTVVTDSQTQLRRRFWGKATLDEMQIGDTLNVIGLWTDSTQSAVQARLVRDVSIQKRFGVFFGTVKGIDNTGNSWNIDTISRGPQTVTISSSTQIINRRGQTITLLSDIQVGHRIRVRGLWDKTNSTITEVSQIKDFSLPVHTTPTPTP